MHIYIYYTCSHHRPPRCGCHVCLLCLILCCSCVTTIVIGIVFIYFVTHLVVKLSLNKILSKLIPLCFSVSSSSSWSSWSSWSAPSCPRSGPLGLAPGSAFSEASDHLSQLLPAMWGRLCLLGLRGQPGYKRLVNPGQTRENAVRPIVFEFVIEFKLDKVNTFG